jgi:hypothetical protein
MRLDPLLTEGVRQLRRGLRRTIGAAPRRQAPPLGTDDIRTIVESMGRSTALGARDAALILLGFASAMRRSGLAALTLVDVEFQPRWSPADHPSVQDRPVRRWPGRRRRHGQYASTDPIAALDAWSGFAARGQDRRSPAQATRRSPTRHSPTKPSRSCSASAPGRPARPPSGSPATRFAPDMPPARRSPASPWTGSPPKRGTSDCRPSSSVTSVPPRRWSTPRAVTWALTGLGESDRLTNEPRCQATAPTA